MFLLKHGVSEVRRCKDCKDVKKSDGNEARAMCNGSRGKSNRTQIFRLPLPFPPRQKYRANSGFRKTRMARIAVSVRCPDRHEIHRTGLSAPENDNASVTLASCLLFDKSGELHSCGDRAYFCELLFADPSCVGNSVRHRQRLGNHAEESGKGKSRRALGGLG